MTYDSKTFIGADDSVMHRKDLQLTVAFILNFRGVNVITSRFNREILLLQVLYWLP